MEPFTIGSVKYESANGRLSCEKCDGQLAAWGENYKDHVKSNRLTANDMRERLSSSFYLKEHDDVEVREFVCPHCGLLLDLEVYTVGEPARADYEPLDAARDRGYDARALFESQPDAWIRFE
jgi:acetone carboxylase gamma subunit